MTEPIPPLTMAAKTAEVVGVGPTPNITNDTVEPPARATVTVTPPQPVQVLVPVPAKTQAQGRACVRGPYDKSKSTPSLKSLAQKAAHKPAAEQRILTQIVPNKDRDIVFGAGGLLNKKREGSVYRQIVEQHWEAYCSIPPNQNNGVAKREFIQKNVLARILALGGRFLERINSTESSKKLLANTNYDEDLMNATLAQFQWRIFDPDDAADSQLIQFKISQAFRDEKKRIKRARQVASETNNPRATSAAEKKQKQMKKQSKKNIKSNTNTTNSATKSAVTPTGKRKYNKRAIATSNHSRISPNKKQRKTIRSSNSITNASATSNESTSTGADIAKHYSQPQHTQQSRTRTIMASRSANSATGSHQTGGINHSFRIMPTTKTNNNHCHNHPTRSGGITNLYQQRLPLRGQLLQSPPQPTTGMPPPMVSIQPLVAKTTTPTISTIANTSNTEKLTTTSPVKARVAWNCTLRLMQPRTQNGKANMPSSSTHSKDNKSAETESFLLACKRKLPMLYRKAKAAKTTTNSHATISSATAKS